MDTLTFGMEGPVMDGTWYNPSTGDSFTVRDSFFEDNQFIVQTTDGRVLGYNQMQNYIKSDKPIEMQPKPSQSEQLPPEVLDIMADIDTGGDLLPEDELILHKLSQTPQSKPLGNLYEENSQKTALPNPTYDFDPNQSIIEKALSKCSLPEFQIMVDWKNYPKREIDMLIDIMDISQEEIINWYLKQVDLNTTTNLISNVIKEYINDQIDTSQALTTEVIDDTPQKKATRVKNTKKKK